MKRVIILVFLLFAYFFSYAYEIKVDTVIVECNDVQVEQLIISISNIDEDTLWIWFDNRVVKDEPRYIKQYLMKGLCNECFSFFDIATDPNMDGSWWKESTSIKHFIKCLMPSQTFTIVLYNENAKRDKKRENINNTWQHLVKIYKQNMIVTCCPGINTSYGINRISYPYSTIVYPLLRVCD